MSADAWHILHGDWQAVAAPQREALLARVSPALAAHLPPFDPALLAISRLPLPFFRRSEGGVQRGLDLYEIAVPGHLDGLGLERWCFFLWDGEADLRPVDWLSATLHNACAEWGFDIGDPGDEEPARLELFLRLFCALVSADEQDLQIATPFAILAPVGDAADAARLRPRATPIPLAPAAAGGFETPPLGAGDDTTVLVAYGSALFRAHFRIARQDANAISVEMTDDAPLGDFGLGLRPLFVRRWADIALLCRGNLPSSRLALAPGDFQPLLSDPATVAAVEAGRAPLRRDTPAAEALALLARAAWGGPAAARPRLEVAGTLPVGSTAAGRRPRLWLRAPAALDLEIGGDLVFEAEHFRGPVDLRRFIVRGTLRGRDARCDSSLVLEDFEVRNEIPVPGPAGANPFGAPQRHFAPVAVQLEGLRCRGDASLNGLRARGSVSLERASVGGKLLLADGDLRRNTQGEPALRADHLRVGASFEMTSTFCRGGVSLKDLRVRGSVDLSGCVVTAERYAFKGGYVEDGVHLERSRIDGDLHVNRQHYCTALEHVTPALIGGDLDLSQVEVAGSIEITCVQVGDCLRLDGVRVGREVIISGLRYTAVPPADIPYSPLADLGLVRNQLTLVGARVGGRVHLGGVHVGGAIDALDLQAGSLQLLGSGSYRLPVLVGGMRGGLSAVGLRLSRARLGALAAEAVQLPSLEARDLTVRGAFRLTGGEAWSEEGLDLSAATEAVLDSWLSPAGGAPAPDGLAGHRQVLRDHLAARSRPAEARPLAAVIGGDLVVNNLRTRADVVIAGVSTGACEISDSTIGGDLRMSGEPLPCTALAVRLTGNEIDGSIELGGLWLADAPRGPGPVDHRLDLSYTHARRGLGIGRRGGPVHAGSCDLTGFVTEADADLAGLELGTAGRTSAPPPVAPRSGWRRIRADLLDPAEATVAAAGGAAVGLLSAGHARVGGRLVLPTGDGVLAAARLPFLHARALQVSGGAFRDAGDGPVALDVSNARIDSFDLCEPLPQRANLQGCEALRWDVTPARDCAPEERPQSAGDESGRYVELLDRSWPFAQDIYARLERDYRDFGEQRIADKFLRHMGWRLWRWSYLRPLFQSRPAQVLLAVALLLAGVAAVTLPQAVAALAGVPLPLGGLLALLALLLAAGVPSRHARDALRSVVGVLVVAPLQLIYGFGVRWWLPLVVSALLLVFVTWPMLQDCRNLATPHEAPLAVAPHGDGACRFEADGQVFTWTPSEAFWRAVQYHVPVIPLEGFYHGEIQEEARPVGAGTPYLRGRPIDERLAFRAVQWIPGVRWLFASPERYARFIHLSSWLVVPFSLVFFAGRLQRKYRLQQG